MQLATMMALWSSFSSICFLEPLIYLIYVQHIIHSDIELNLLSQYIRKIKRVCVCVSHNFRKSQQTSKRRENLMEYLKSKHIIT